MFIETFLRRLFKRNFFKLLESDYLKIRNIGIFKCDSSWCLEENRILINIERNDIGEGKR